jgi:hypothetical protein
MLCRLLLLAQKQPKRRCWHRYTCCGAATNNADSMWLQATASGFQLDYLAVALLLLLLRMLITLHVSATLSAAAPVMPS